MRSCLAPRMPGFIWVRDLTVGDVMVDRSFRVERLRPLGLWWAATLTWWYPSVVPMADPATSSNLGLRQSNPFAGLSRERMKGLEPSTFAMATPSTFAEAHRYARYGKLEYGFGVPSQVGWLPILLPIPT